MSNSYAPVLIPTLCRYNHFKNCVESLQKNTLAKHTTLYIALDYPKKPAHFDGYNKILEFINDGITGFRSVVILKREKNFGASKNIFEAKREVFKTYDKLILSEDDNVFSPCFLSFMNDCFNRFEKDDNVLAINGFACPTEYFDDGSNLVKTKYIFSAWGVGYWRKKEHDLDDYLTLKKYRGYLKNKEKCRTFYSEFPRNFCYFVNSTLSRSFRKTDVVRQSYMYFENKYVIFPKLSLVRNTGWDGTGTHKIEAFKDKDLGFSQQTINDNKEFVIKDVENLQDHYENLYILNKCLPCTPEFRNKTEKVLKLVKIFGIKFFYLCVDFVYIITYPFRKLRK